MDKRSRSPCNGEFQMSDISLVQLDAAEAAQLTRYEERISQGLASFIEVGEALSAIRDRKLYRATHGTFEDYCRVKWGMSKRHCDRLISSAEVVQSLGPIGPKLTTESQARELARVEPAKREEVVQKAVVATGGKITASAIREAAMPITLEVVRVARDEAKPIYSMARVIWQGVKPRLDDINKSDPELNEVMREISTYALGRIK
jgi:hypothetical protein